MSAEFFYRKLLIALCAVALFFTAIPCVYAGIISHAESVDIATDFYFLVSDDVQVEAGAEFARLEGGAGYLLEHGKGEYVALSVYFDKADGLAVQNRLEEDTLLLHKGVKRLYFKGKTKKKSTLYVHAIRTFEGYISVLNECISRLEKGMTQESCKRLLKLLERQFKHAQTVFGGYEAFQKVCAESQKELADICEETVYLKDLRYLLCWQAEKYVELCAAFAL